MHVQEAKNRDVQGGGRAGRGHSARGGSSRGVLNDTRAGRRRNDRTVALGYGSGQCEPRRDGRQQSRAGRRVVRAAKEAIRGVARSSERDTDGCGGPFSPEPRVGAGLEVARRCIHSHVARRGWRGGVCGARRPGCTRGVSRGGAGARKSTAHRPNCARCTAKFRSLKHPPRVAFPLPRFISGCTRDHVAQPP